MAIDYDLTYTQDPDYWDEVVRIGRARGHDFVCITGRTEPPGASGSERVPPMKVICSPDSYKVRAAARAGLKVDVWADDCPGSIEPGRVVEWDD